MKSQLSESEKESLKQLHNSIETFSKYVKLHIIPALKEATKSIERLRECEIK
jgi:hypothetical protein